MDVEKIAGVIGDPDSWTVRAVESGELVTVPNPSGIGLVRMYKSEAIRLGLWKEQGTSTGSAQKARGPARNKMRRPARNKGNAPAE